MTKRRPPIALAILSGLVTVLSLPTSRAQSPANPSTQTQKPRPSPTPPSTTDDVIRINTKLVQVDTVVTDNRGRQVTDLTASDFEIVEEGRKHTPEYCTYVAATTKGTETATVTGHPTADQLGRVFVFVVSNPIIEFTSSFANNRGTAAGSLNTQARAIRAADSMRSLLSWFVDSQLSETDIAAIADTDVDIGVLSSFTNDRKVLHAAIERVRDNAVSGRSPVVRVSLVNSDPTVQWLVQQHLRTLETLENVIEQVAPMPGRKVVTFIARGLLYNPSHPYSQVINERLERLTAKANRARISIYTVQARDLKPAGGNLGSDGLIHLSRETGGRAIYNSNDLRVGFDQIIEESRGYYLLAYNPGADADGRPHRLKINIKRPGLKIASRSEAFTRSQPTTQSSTHPLESALAAKDIEVTVAPTLVRVGRKTRVTISWRIDLSHAESQSRIDGLLAFSLDLSVRVAGPDGRMLKQTDRNTSFEVSGDELGTIRREGLVSKFEFETEKAGFYRIAVSVNDKNSGRLGRTTRFVRVD